MSLPEPRDPAGPYRVSVVCLGNICRSPMAEKVLTADLERAGMSDLVRVDSSGTGDWHVGGGMDPRAASTLRVHGYLTDHTARQFAPTDLADRDLILVMDLDNYDDLLRVVEERGEGFGFEPSRLLLFRSFAPGRGPNPEVPDPYYGGDDGFTAVLNMVEAAAKGLTNELVTRLRG
ncbi:low molecular weight protein-tyrosine-phosphatase [Nocardiopsis sp. MG754419]|uniref:low molecular weight protein-tyrosine-phosphatase n=1 Tax=Nocardiopsis sp. MG754419 TaxID=2259865 RepID=UPI001BA4ED7D|nr:low molecular weight protein-tyrosine-phosphatase [Nocardiopsis sp. MG754419]MBR8741155.1 low molecular weight phosphotyrosine protein phosphatase [Nocardiopsis sp. MG754419]